MELTGNLKEQVTKAKSLDEAKSVIENAGMKLTDDELNMVAGGAGFIHAAPKGMRDGDELATFEDQRVGSWNAPVVRGTLEGWQK